MEIKLEFCVVWNYTPRAVSTIEDILEIYGNKVTSINLIPSGGGVFEFHLNDELLFLMWSLIFAIAIVNKGLDIRLEKLIKNIVVKIKILFL